ncbi:putative RTA1 domain protein [Macroventuria anomochaeta]|uniref:RTA1 domain protein n=1 Tax=Macroventuria anomochaeta TaxID=301207 RepID=A0ACB6RZ36_9PLEO|nr:putative RTA1 domain protein [Macroventuria anomochaeta]KAF2626199.1 putative RTA1 domain protein [Macroventuria anomochaeta]
MAVLEPYRDGYYLWNYVPSIGAAVIFILLSLVMTASISWHMSKIKTWFCVPFVIGVEFAGYYARASAHNKTGRVMPYSTQSVFILLGPALFAASIYMCLSRIIRGVHGNHHSLVKPSWLTKIFVTGDVLSFVVQGGVAGLMVSGNSIKTGEGMVIGGLMIQIIMFGLFAVTAVLFQRRIERRPTPESCSSALPTLIMVRSIFRVAEYAMGNDGYLLKHEWTLYIFDTTLIFAVMVVCFLWYPTRITPDKLEPQSYAI